MNIISALMSKAYLLNTSQLNDNLFKVEFQLRNQEVIPLIMYFTEEFPYRLPDVCIDTTIQKYIPNKPHISSSGDICYLDKEGVVWNDDYSLTLDFVFKRIEKVLFQKSKEIEFHREFLYYFSNSKGCKYATSLISQDTTTKEIQLIIDKKHSPKLFYEKDEKNLLVTKKELELEHNQVVNGVYIYFERVLDLYVPNSNNFWNAQEIADLVIRNCSQDTIKSIVKLSKNRVNNYYLLNIRLLDEQRVLIGLWYKRKNDKVDNSVPILSKGDNFDIKPIVLFRIDDERLLRRGGAITNGKEKSILLIGCGSVGSDILFLLARSGFKRFTIVDKDVLEVDNTYRHFLGFNYSCKYKPKVESLKIELEKRYRDIEVKTINVDVFKALRDKKLNISDYDLVISAMGDVNEERLLNNSIVKTNTPIIYSWVEAFGLGGHAALVNINFKGCYNCFIDKELRNIMNFAGNNDKPFVTNIDGCLGTYTEYGGLDSMQTANIVARLVIELFSGKTNEPKIVSWKGDANKFLSKGYKLSESYYEFNLGVGERKFKEGCKLCNG